MSQLRRNKWAMVVRSLASKITFSLHNACQKTKSAYPAAPPDAQKRLSSPTIRKAKRRSKRWKWDSNPQPSVRLPNQVGLNRKPMRYHYAIPPGDWWKIWAGKKLMTAGRWKWLSICPASAEKSDLQGKIHSKQPRIFQFNKETQSLRMFMK